MRKFKLLCVAGARPNFMKIAPLLRVLRASPLFEAPLLHTGQHYDESLSGRFFRDLNLPAPDHRLEAGSGSHAQQTATVMLRIEPLLAAEKPDAVVVVGDVNSTVAAALAAAKLGIPVFHVEAGLRSFDRSMPEEINRVVTDALSDLLLITEAAARANLLKEGAAEHRIHFVGNLMIDSLRQHLEVARRSDVLSRLGIERGAYGVLTLHRPSNVDDEDRLVEMLSAAAEISAAVPLVFPAHPRTRDRLARFGARLGVLKVAEPLGYLDFLCLLDSAAAVLTDSGGIQEETTALGVPCLTLRDNTERPVTIAQGTNVLAGTTRDSILRAWNEVRLRRRAPRVPPLWDGAAAERCLGVFTAYFQHRPAFTPQPGNPLSAPSSGALSGAAMQ